MPSTTPDLRMAAGRDSSVADAGGGSCGQGLSIGAGASRATGVAGSLGLASPSATRGPRLGQTDSNDSECESRDFELNRKSRRGLFRTSTAAAPPGGAAPSAPAPG